MLEALIDGDGEWDALVAERDTPVMDGFQIASALRDFEKARRNRASMVRAAAVEEHARAAGGAASSGRSVEQRDTGGKASKLTEMDIFHLLGRWVPIPANPGRADWECLGACGRGLRQSAQIFLSLNLHSTRCPPH